MEKLRIGVIGAGGIPTAHLPHLKERDDVEFAAVMDVDGSRAETFAAEHGFAFHTTNMDDLWPRIDAVLICVPTAFHSDAIIAALDNGKAVFSEKPMTRTLEQAAAVKAKLDETGLPFQVGFVRRFDDEWMAFRKAIQEKKIGRPVVWHNVAFGHGPAAPWFNNDAIGGGPFMDGCVHNVDFALHTFGPAKWAFCNGRTFREGSTAIDAGTATVQFESGDELMLTWSWGLPKGCSGTVVFQFAGAEGMITWPHDEAADATEGHFVINRGEDEGKEDVFFPKTALHDGFKKQINEFVEVAKGNAKPSASWQEGNDSLAVILAILESARTEKVVAL